MNVIVALLVVVLSVVSIFRLNSYTSKIGIRISSDDYLDQHSKYQLLLLVLSIVVLVLVYLQNPGNFVQFFRFGDLMAPAAPVSWFGIGEGRSWLFAGAYLSIVITLGTLTFVFMQFRHLGVALREVAPYIKWALLFSLANSFSEEMIFRIGIVSPLMGEIDSTYVALISAFIFGVAHFSGMPHGVIGMAMAGFLGWFLAKSVIDTQGIFWAWFIHFIQDVVIYIGFLLSRIRAIKDGKLAAIG